MGSSLSVCGEAQFLLSLDQEKVQALFDKYIELDMEFGITPADILVLFKECGLDFGKAEVEQLMSLFPNQEILNALDFFEGLNAIHEGSTLESKASLAFDIFDFQRVSEISFDELTIMLMSVARGSSLLLGLEATSEPDDDKIAEMVKVEFNLKSESEEISKDNFLTWFVKKWPDDSSIDFISLVEFLSCTAYKTNAAKRTESKKESAKENEDAVQGGAEKTNIEATPGAPEENAVVDANSTAPVAEDTTSKTTNNDTEQDAGNEAKESGGDAVVQNGLQESKEDESDEAAPEEGEDNKSNETVPEEGKENKDSETVPEESKESKDHGAAPEKQEENKAAELVNDSVTDAADSKEPVVEEPNATVDNAENTSSEPTKGEENENSSKVSDSGPKGVPESDEENKSSDLQQETNETEKGEHDDDILKGDGEKLSENGDSLGNADSSAAGSGVAQPTDDVMTTTNSTASSKGEDKDPKEISNATDGADKSEASASTESEKGESGTETSLPKDGETDEIKENKVESQNADETVAVKQVSNTDEVPSPEESITVNDVKEGSEKAKQEVETGDAASAEETKNVNAANPDTVEESKDGEIDEETNLVNDDKQVESQATETTNNQPKATNVAEASEQDKTAEKNEEEPTTEVTTETRPKQADSEVEKATNSEGDAKEIPVVESEGSAGAEDKTGAKGSEESAEKNDINAERQAEHAPDAKSTDAVEVKTED